MAELEPGNAPDGKQFVWLQRLVVALTGTMILGIIILVGLALSAFFAERPAPDWPTSLALPQGETLAALTRSDDWLIAVTNGPGGQRVHVLSPDGQRRLQTIDLP